MKRKFVRSSERRSPLLLMLLVSLVIHAALIALIPIGAIWQPESNYVEIEMLPAEDLATAAADATAETIPTDLEPVAPIWQPPAESTWDWQAAAGVPENSPPVSLAPPRLSNQREAATETALAAVAVERSAAKMMPELNPLPVPAPNLAAETVATAAQPYPAPLRAPDAPMETAPQFARVAPTLPDQAVASTLAALPTAPRNLLHVNASLPPALPLPTRAQQKNVAAAVEASRAPAEPLVSEQLAVRAAPTNAPVVTLPETTVSEPVVLAPAFPLNRPDSAPAVLSTTSPVGAPHRTADMPDVPAFAVETRASMMKAEAPATLSHAKTLPVSRAADVSAAVPLPRETPLPGAPATSAEFTPPRVVAALPSPALPPVFATLTAFPAQTKNIADAARSMPAIAPQTRARAKEISAALLGSPRAAEFSGETFVPAVVRPLTVPSVPAAIVAPPILPRAPFATSPAPRTTTPDADTSALPLNPVQRRGARPRLTLPGQAPVPVFGVIVPKPQPVEDVADTKRLAEQTDVVEHAPAAVPARERDEPVFKIEGPAAGRRVLSKPSHFPELKLARTVAIRLKFWVLADGSVGDVVPLQRGDLELERAAMQYLKSWRFTPVAAGSQTVWGIVPITYRLR